MKNRSILSSKDTISYQFTSNGNKMQKIYRIIGLYTFLFHIKFYFTVMSNELYNLVSIIISCNNNV